MNGDDIGADQGSQIRGCLDCRSARRAGTDPHDDATNAGPSRWWDQGERSIDVTRELVAEVSLLTRCLATRAWSSDHDKTGIKALRLLDEHLGRIAECNRCRRGDSGTTANSQGERAELLGPSRPCRGGSLVDDHHRDRR